MSARPKKAAPEKAALKAPPRAAPPTPPKTGAPAVAVDGVDRARLNRLAAAGYDVERCSLLGIPLDVGPRAPDWATPVKLVGDVVSDLGARIIASGVDPSALELAAARLRKAAGDVL